MFKKYGFCLLLWMSAAGALSQVQSGLYPYGSFDTAGMDSIDRGSLNVHFSIPVVDKQGRGIGFQYSLVYDSLVWTPVGAVGAQTWTPAVGFGLHGQLNEGFEGYLSYYSSTTKCFQGSSFTFVPRITNYVYHDQFGVSHPFNYNDNYCTDVETGGGPSPDGSGYSFSGGNVTAANGTQISVPANSQTASGTVTDANGNYIKNNGNGTFTDTLGTTALTITGSGTPTSAKVFTYSTLTGTAQATVTYKAYQVQTKFACAVSEYNLPQNLVDTITLADGSEYKFGYEPTPGNAANVTGRLAQLTLPQGGVVTYAYTGANAGIICADGTPAGLTRTGDVNRTYVRSAVTATSSHTAVTDGLLNTSAYDFAIAGAPEAFYETNRSVNQGTSTQLLARQTCYNNSAHPCTTTAVGLPITQIDTYETLNGTQQHGSKLTYNSYGLLTSRSDYDFNGASRATSPMRQETWTYPTTGIVNLVSSDTIVDGLGNAIGSTGYTYDEVSTSGHPALVTTSGLPNHNPVSGQRGNLTTVAQASGTGAIVYTRTAYEDTGNPVGASAPSNLQTTGLFSTYGYDSATHGFATAVTPWTPSSGVALPSSATYDANSGVLLTAVDPNNQTTTYRSYDSRIRPTEIDYPDGGKATATYRPTGATITHDMNSATHTTTQEALNTWGQLLWVALYNATGGYYWNNYCYDLNGNLQYAAYRFAAPNQSNNSCSGAGDSYTYDGLGRVMKLTRGDGSYESYSYSGRDTQMTDENGVSRVTQVDGLGRPTAVCEISLNAQNGVSPSNCSLDITTASGFKTTYTYATDTSAANAAKLTVVQGAQTRSFEADWLGRPTSVVQPESGTATYSYAYSTGAGLGLTVNRIRPQANQTGSLTTTTTTQYDVLGREVSVNYSDGVTPNRGWAYDVDNYWTQPSTNLKGRVAATGGGTGATWNGSALSYDVMGRVTSLWQCGPASCGTANQATRPLTFAYDWLGNITQSTDAASGTIVYGRSVAGEVTSITNQTYTNLPQDPPNLVSNVVNGPDGPISYTQGNGLNVLLVYNQTGRLRDRFVCKGAATASCSGGTQIYGNDSPWKGSRLTGQSDTALNQGVGFGYDEFNRLNSRTVTVGTVQNYNYSYDRYGNRVTQTPLNGGYSFNPTINAANNHITTSGYAYDAAGNMTNDSVNAYTYDAEGNITKVVNAGGTSQYVYDVFNRRVHVQTPSGTTEYIYDYAGKRISAWPAPANNAANEGRIYWGGQLFGYRSSDGSTYFEHQDSLGTERMRTTYSGTVGATFVSLPWGDGYAATVNTSAANQDNNQFAGLEHDAESNTEHAQFRNYASAQGRWLTPDPYFGSYDLTNPQSFNRYSYVLNNPLSLVDPSGLYGCGDDGGVLDPSSTDGNIVVDGGCGSDGGDTDCWWCSEYGGGSGPTECWWCAVQPGAGVVGAVPPPPRLARLSQHTGFDNPLANALFSPQVGGAYFGGANSAVNYAALGTTLAYGAAFTLPSLVGGGGIAEVAIGTQDAGVHFAVGVDGEFMHGAAGLFLRNSVEMTSDYAADFALGALKIPIPVLDVSAVLPQEGTLVSNCFTGVCSAIIRGWIP